MECFRCGNKDPQYFYKGHKGYYCRKCIRYSRVLLEEEPETFSYEINDEAGEYRFDYPLTKTQIAASNACLENLKYGDILLHAVCGAGKTEISIQSISYFLSSGMKVAYAIPRKEVVIELEKRFKKIFSKADVISVYGGHHDRLSGDLIICTTHQLYRYYKSFDLLVLDAYGIIGLNSKDSANKGFLKLSPILFSPQKRLMIDLRRKHAQNEDLSAKRSAACNSGSTVSDVVPSHLLQRQSVEHTPDVDLYRITVRYPKDVSLACAA